MLKPFKISSEVISRISSPILILAAAILSNSLTPNLTVAQTKQNESIPKVAFRKAPRLLDIYTTFDRVRSRSAIYYFDITIPEDSGAPLQKIEIELLRIAAAKISIGDDIRAIALGFILKGCNMKLELFLSL